MTLECQQRASVILFVEGTLKFKPVRQQIKLNILLAKIENRQYIARNSKMNEMQRTRNVLISIVNQHLFGITTRGLYNKYRKELNGSSPISKSAMISLIANQLSDVIGSHTLGRVVFYRPVVTKHSANTLPSNREQSPVATLSFPTSIENEWDREPEPQETWTRLSYERELEIYSLEFPQSVAAILKPNTMEVVRVSQINAPSKFWIQLQNHDVELEKLHQNLR